VERYLVADSVATQSEDTAILATPALAALEVAWVVLLEMAAEHVL
jgi:hypothetical protein